MNNTFFYLLIFGLIICIILLLFNTIKAHQKIRKLTKKIQNQTPKDRELDLLNERERYRREFLGNVSHELKTPLFAIQGYVLTLIEGAINDKKYRDRYLERINKSVDRLIYVVKDLDLLAELESGTLHLDIVPFNIHTLAQEVFDLLEIKAEKNNVSLLFKENYIKPLNVLGDSEKIEQVITNLVANAISHSHKKEAKVIVEFIVENDTLITQVKDDGVGIPEEHIQRVFERFYRIDSARSREHGGSGLGLSIVKNIVEAHNGKIWVESKPGQGAAFSFSLPLAK